MRAQPTRRRGCAPADLDRLRVPTDGDGKPLGKTREYVEIVRTILAREAPLEHHGPHYDIPYTGDDATGLGKPLKIIVHPRRADIPIYLYGETRTSQHIPNDSLRELHGFIHMFEDTPEFVARHIIREAKGYLDGLAPPFFKALMDYAQDGSYSWHCPGHSGGVAFLKSPVGQMFHQFFGENMLRADVCNAVEELGQLLDHTGPVAASERNAARIFGSDHMFFVTNGTSTSNKMVWHANVAPGDIVVVDRNCHKSILHAIMMTGAIPVFLMPTRNHFGIIGPIPKSEFEPETIAKKIADHPFASQAKNKKPRILTITQGTYDGVLYNAEMIKNMLSTEIDTLHFDEAWLPHASFHPFYEDMHAIGHGRARSKDALVFATQSTHELLAGLSQASQILVQDSETRKLDTYRFNEAYLMHTSTSPQYSIIASCDVAAAMMEPPGGTALVEESIMEALDFRRAMRKVDDEWGKDWWFKVWGPEKLADDGIGEREDWLLKANAKWHGFGNLAPGFNMLDPIKATLITPGLDVSGKFDKERWLERNPFVSDVDSLKAQFATLRAREPPLERSVETGGLHLGEIAEGSEVHAQHRHARTFEKVHGAQHGSVAAEAHCQPSCCRMLGRRQRIKSRRRSVGGSEPRPVPVRREPIGHAASHRRHLAALVMGDEQHRVRRGHGVHPVGSVVACTRNSRLPSVPVIGESVQPSTVHRRSSRAACTSALTRSWMAGSVITPCALATSTLPASNCGFTSSTR